jgi:hypothetical protein
VPTQRKNKPAVDSQWSINKIITKIVGRYFEGFAARVVEGIDATVGAAQDGVKGGADAAAARRRRLPLAVRGDGVVRPYSRDDAEGLHLLRSAVMRDSLGARHRPFASGRFEDTLHVAGGRVLLLSHRHVGVVVGLCRLNQVDP